jgi:cob(I)alamin adenosyltransferase
MGILRQVAEYLYLKKKDPNAPRTQWLKYMHGINRLSILLFLVAMVILAVKLLRK